MDAPDAPPVRLFAWIVIVEILSILALYWFGRQFS
jgi:hypothetical protein